jgi:AAA domain
MAIDLKRISEGKQPREPRVLIYGGDGVGKTKWAVGAPDPFFIDVNRGSLPYDVKRILPDTWTEAMEWIGAVETGIVKCRTLVIDSISDLEHMGNAEFFPNTTIDKWDGGYGHGEGYALARWRELLSAVERVWMTGKAIILIGHMQVKRFDDPAGPGYERYEVAARKNLAGLLRQTVDYVFFAKEDVAQQKVAGGDIKMVTNGTRWIHTQRSPAFDAKSRGTTLFPERVLLSWDAFVQARAADNERVEMMSKEIEAMLKEIGDKKLNDVVKEYLRANPGMVVETRNRVAARLEEMRSAAAKPVAQMTSV